MVCIAGVPTNYNLSFRGVIYHNILPICHLYVGLRCIISDYDVTNFDATRCLNGLVHISMGSRSDADVEAGCIAGCYWPTDCAVRHHGRDARQGLQHGVAAASSEMCIMEPG